MMLKIPTPKLHYDMEQENPPPPFGHLSPIFNENGDRNILHNQIKFYPAKMVVQVPRGLSQTIYSGLPYDPGPYYRSIIINPTQSYPGEGDFYLTAYSPTRRWVSP